MADDLPKQYGEDGHGPPPTPEVIKVRDRFFGDEPRPIDERVAERLRRHPNRSF